MTNQKVNGYISDLLCEHDCVIIPHFGGFVANYSSAHVDINTNYMFAPKKSIVFNRSLQNNDGLLVNEIALCEGLTFKQAQKVLDKYVLNLNESLKLYKKIFIDGVGTLLLTSEENLLFVQSDARNHLLDSYGFTTIQYPIIERHSVQNKLEKKLPQLHRIGFKNHKKSWLRVAAVLIPLFIISALGISKKDRIFDSYANLFPFNTKETLIKTNSSNTSIYEVASPTLNIEGALSQFHNSKKQQSSEAIQVDDSSIQLYIIAGAFSSLENAEKLIYKLRKDGFKNATIVGQSQSGLYRVAYNGYIQTNSAMLALENIRANNPDAWLLTA